MDKGKAMEARRQRLLTEKDVSAITLLSCDTLRTMRCRRVGIPFLKLGASVRYEPEAVERYLESCRVEVAA